MVSHYGAMKALARAAAAIRKLDCGWKIHFQDGSFTWLFIRSFGSCLWNTLHGCLSDFMPWQLGSSQGSNPRWKWQWLSWPDLESHTQTSVHILFVESESHVHPNQNIMNIFKNNNRLWKSYFDSMFSFLLLLLLLSCFSHVRLYATP